VVSGPGRYYDDSSVAKLGSPQYWFGYGMSYSSFRYSNLSLSATAGCRVTAATTVTNVGKVAAREVAQLYLARPKPASSVPTAAWALRGYQRTDVLAAGASVTLYFAVSARELSTVLVDGSRSVTAGDYTVKIGGANPRDTRAPATPVGGSVHLAAGCSTEALAS
jgi:beta-glucosidase